MEKLRTAYENWNDWSGGTLEVFRLAIQRFNKAQSSQAASAMAYYAMFALFPLLLLLIAAGSFFRSSRSVSLCLVSDAVPVGAQYPSEMACSGLGRLVFRCQLGARCFLVRLVRGEWHEQI